MTREEAQALIAKTPEFIPGTCSWCGATTMDEASVKCRPMMYPSGDYVCGVPEEAPDTDGLIHVSNPAYERLNGYLWGWYAVDEGWMKTPPEWDDTRNKDRTHD